MIRPSLPSAEDWYERRRVEKIDEIRSRARRLFGKSVMLVGIGDTEAEATARRMLQVAASAFWNAEDSEYEDDTHHELDKYGRWVRENFVCQLTFEDGAYYQRCPVAIAHLKVGMSIGFTAQRICSICGDDISECPHRSDTLYEVSGGIGPHGLCRVCGGSNCNEHMPDQTYSVPPTRIIMEIDNLHEISLVRKPAQPDARLASIPVGVESLRASLGPSFRPGIRVKCDRCLGRCGGIEEVVRPQ